MASLMLIHDLYPVPLEERVQEALDSVRPYMESHGGNVELLGIEDGVARLRLEGSCHGCAASASTLELAVEEALRATAPDLEGIDVEGVVEPPAPPAIGTFELPMAGGGGPVSGWQALDVDVGARAGCTTAAALLIANVAGDLLAYRNRCAGCGGALDHGDLSGGTLICPTCARRFDLPRAGRWARTGCSSARCRCCATATPCGSRWHEGGPAEPRHQPPPAPPGRASAAAGGGRRGRGAVRAVHARDPPDAPAPAAPRGAADPVRVRDVLGGALGRRRVPPGRQPHGVARRLRALRRAAGRRSRSRSGSRSSWTRPCRAGWSGCTRARRARPSASSTSRRGRRWCADNPVLETLEADAEALVINRMADPPQHAIVPIDVAYQLVGVVKASWEGISGGAGDRGGGRGLLRGAAMSVPDPTLRGPRGRAGRARRGADAEVHCCA